MKGRIKEADVGVPARYNGYWYYGRTLEGSQYQVHMRRSAADGRAALVETSGPDLTKNSREEVLLDENKRKEEGGFKFYAVRCVVHWEGFCRGTGFQGHRRGLRRACQPGGGSLRASRGEMRALWSRGLLRSARQLALLSAWGGASLGVLSS
jgi:hypothetical protein